MKKQSLAFIEELIKRYPPLIVCKSDILSATELLIRSYKGGGKLLICGNGGSAADSEHIVGELMKGFCLPRHINGDLAESLRKVSKNSEYLIQNLQYGLPSISLVSHTALSTAFANDMAPDVCFAQEVLGYGKKGDVLLGISTSGDSKNVVYATEVAKAIGVKTIALTGEKQNKLENIADITIKAPSLVTYKIQEFHLPVYHAICLALENEFFGE
jgi:D-sedoheptulose 7-phosphate isomerase